MLPVGQQTWNWIRAGGQPTRGGRLRLWTQRWRNWWFEHHLEWQRKLPPSVPLSQDPLFILGLWRSGTTYMHDLLATCPGMIYPATWQVMNAGAFRLQRPPSSARQVQRPMDSLMISALSPQEDEFALLQLGVPTVYRGFFDPRRLPDLVRWLDPSAWDEHQPEGWSPVWREFLGAVADGRPGRLVLKSPNHSFRLRALRTLFPGGSYVWLIRDPTQTFYSNRKMWMAMFREYALWNWDPGVLDEFLSAALVQAAECLEEACGSLPRDRFVAVDFGRLTAEPLATVQALNLRLALGPWQGTESTLGKVIAEGLARRTEIYPPQSLPPSAVQAIARLQRAQTDALVSHG